MEQLFHAPQGEEIDILYSIIRHQDPDFLNDFDQKQFADTPLHLATGEGRTQLALEIQRLMPSFGKKLNPDGLTPVDLALRRGHRETVRAMVKLDPELVGVQGREGVTPLHYTAETDDADLLAEFLIRCPESIEKLTIRGESAVHLAVKMEKYAAFSVLYGWLKRNFGINMFRWRDWKGDTVLHLAASRINQPQMLEIVKKYCHNVKNSSGLTVLDMVMEPSANVNRRTIKALERGGAKRGSSISNPKISTCADYLMSKLYFMEYIIKIHTMVNWSCTGDTRNALLVVAVLIVTTTYQGVLQPPGSSMSTTTPTNTNITANNITETQGSGYDGNKKSLMPRHDNDIDLFLSFNYSAFVFSLGVIILIVPVISLYSGLLYICLIYLTQSYVVAINVISPKHIGSSVIIEIVILALCLLVKILGVPFELQQAFARLTDGKRFYSVDNMVHHVLQRKYFRREHLS